MLSLCSAGSQGTTGMEYLQVTFTAFSSALGKREISGPNIKIKLSYIFYYVHNKLVYFPLLAFPAVSNVCRHAHESYLQT
jgi:hypothetical protein